MTRTEEAVNRMLILVRDHTRSIEKYLEDKVREFLAKDEAAAQKASYRLPYDASLGALVREAGLAAPLEVSFKLWLAQWLEAEHNFSDKEALTTLVFESLCHDYFLLASARAARHFFQAQPGKP